MPTNIKYKLVFFVLFSIIFIQGILLIFRKPKIITVKDDTKELRDSIDMYKKQVDLVVARAQRYTLVIDSLKLVSSKIPIFYAKQKAIIPNASMDQLDSIIRNNSGIR